MDAQEDDANTFANNWTIDFLKYDSCLYNGNVASRARYLAMSRALNATGRKIFYSVEGWHGGLSESSMSSLSLFRMRVYVCACVCVCVSACVCSLLILSFQSCSDGMLLPSVGSGSDGDWGPEYANMWRTGNDIWPRWDKCILNNLYTTNRVAQYMIPGKAWNDPDMLQPPGYVPGRTAIPGLTFEESRAQFVLWSVMKAPLILGLNYATYVRLGYDGDAAILGTTQKPQAWGFLLLGAE